MVTLMNLIPDSKRTPHSDLCHFDSGKGKLSIPVHTTWKRKIAVYVQSPFTNKPLQVLTFCDRDSTIEKLFYPLLVPFPGLAFFLVSHSCYRRSRGNRFDNFGLTAEFEKCRIINMNKNKHFLESKVLKIHARQY